MRKISTIIILCMLMTLLIPFKVLADTKSQTKIAINGIYVEFNDSTGYPFVDSNNRTQVPFRVTLEKFGAKVSWDNATRTAIAEKEGIRIEVPIGKKHILKNGQMIENDTVALIKDGRTYLPIRIVMEAFGSKVGWNGETKTVEITSSIIDLKSKITSLTKNTAGFNVVINEAKEEKLKNLYAVLTSKEGIIEKPINKIGENKVVFDNLDSDTEYHFEVYNKADKEVLDTVNFKTFTGEKDAEYHYFIDVRSGDTNKVEVTVLGAYKNRSDLYFNHYYNGGGVDKLRLVEDSLKIILDGTFSYQKKLTLIHLKFNKTSGYYKIVYQTDKSYLDTNDHGCQGILTDQYLMVQGEQMLITPSEQLETEGIAVSIIAPNGWGSEVGFEATALDNLYVIGSLNKLILNANYYTFNKELFNIQEREIYGSTVVTVIEKTVEEDYAGAILEIYDRLCNIWGDVAAKDRYCLMIINDKRQIYAGEWDRGQGFSSAWGIGEMLVHQIYHRWNGWEYALGLWTNPSSDITNDGLWLEGFNEYYCYKILDEMGYDGKRYMQGWYNEYKADIKSNKDVSILEDENKTGMAVYHKGAVIAYALNKQIEERTNAKHSLDDVLKYFWNEFKVNGQSGNYAKMLVYIKTIVPGGIDDWWQEYVVNNKEIILEEFE